MTHDFAAPDFPHQTRCCTTPTPKKRGGGTAKRCSTCRTPAALEVRQVRQGFCNAGRYFSMRGLRTRVPVRKNCRAVSAPSPENSGRMQAVSAHPARSERCRCAMERKLSMTRAITFTQAQVRRAVKAAESAGLRVTRVTVNSDGSITVDSGDNPLPAIDSRKVPLATWDDL